MVVSANCNRESVTMSICLFSKKIIDYLIVVRCTMQIECDRCYLLSMWFILQILSLVFLLGGFYETLTGMSCSMGISIGDAVTLASIRLPSSTSCAKVMLAISFRSRFFSRIH